MATLYISNKNGNIFSDNFYEGGVPSFNEATKNRLDEINEEIDELQNHYEAKANEINTLNRGMKPLNNMRQNDRLPNEAYNMLNNYNNTADRLGNELTAIDEKIDALRKESSEIDPNVQYIPKVRKNNNLAQTLNRSLKQMNNNNSRRIQNENRRKQEEVQETLYTTKLIENGNIQINPTISSNPIGVSKYNQKKLNNAIKNNIIIKIYYFFVFYIINILLM